MTIDVNKTPISIELVITGRLDTGTAPELEVKLKEVAPQTQTLYLNMKDVQYISSSGLRLFLSLRKAAGEKGGKVIVKNISNEIRTVFMMTGFLNLFEIQ